MKRRLANQKGVNSKIWYKGDAFQYKFRFFISFERAIN